MAKGIKLQMEARTTADYIIAAADGYEVIYNLLKGKYTDETIETLFADKTYPVYSSIYISLGIEADLSTYPHTALF